MNTEACRTMPARLHVNWALTARVLSHQSLSTQAGPCGPIGRATGSGRVALAGSWPQRTPYRGRTVALAP